jgi:hypothetical protein
MLARQEVTADDGLKEPAEPIQSDAEMERKVAADHDIHKDCSKRRICAAIALGLLLSLAVVAGVVAAVSRDKSKFSSALAAPTPEALVVVLVLLRILFSK